MKIGLRTIKTVIASVCAMVLADALHLLYAPAAGVIAILSVGNTKKASLYIGLGRLGSLVIATLLSFLCFALIGYNAVGFGLFLLLFIPISAKLKLTDGIVVNSVLVTHYLLEQSYAWSLLLNELLLMSVGVGFALLMNLYMPDSEKELKNKQEVIEEGFRSILANLVAVLNHQPKDILDGQCEKLAFYIREGQQQAQRYQENHWQSSDAYYEEYFAMRRTQIRMLTDMTELLKDIEVKEDIVSDLRQVLMLSAKTFQEKNDGSVILAAIANVEEMYRKKTLPVNREEFENRARLFQFTQSFKSFIEIKAEFSKTIQK
jgi:Predicted membrane protein